MDHVDFLGQMSKVKFTIHTYRIKFIKTIEVKHCLYIKPVRHVHHGERMNPMDFGGQGHDGYHFRMCGTRACYAL